MIGILILWSLFNIIRIANKKRHFHVPMALPNKENRQALLSGWSLGVLPSLERLILGFLAPVPPNERSHVRFPPFWGVRAYELTFFWIFCEERCLFPRTFRRWILPWRVWFPFGLRRLWQVFFYELPRIRDLVSSVLFKVLLWWKFWHIPFCYLLFTPTLK